MKDLDGFLQKKYVSEYRYLVDELDYSRARFGNYNDKFKNDFATDIAENIKARAKVQPIPTENPSVDVATEETEEITVPRLRRLYRRLILICHPDKTNGDSATFHKVEQAYKRGDAIGLLDAARQLNIEMDDKNDDEMDMTAAMRRSIAIMRKDIERLTSSLAWVWCTATEEDRPRLRNVISASIRSCS